MKEFILVIRGPSGSGKTTLSKQIQESIGEKVAYLKADYFYWKVCPQDKNKHLDENPLVHANLLDLTENYLEAGYSVILEGLLNRIDEYGLGDNLEKLSKRFNVIYKRIYLDVDLETAKIRHAQSDFSIPIEEAEGWAPGREMKKSTKDIVINTLGKFPKDVLEEVLKFVKK